MAFGRNMSNSNEDQHTAQHSSCFSENRKCGLPSAYLRFAECAETVGLDFLESHRIAAVAEPNYTSLAVRPCPSPPTTSRKPEARQQRSSAASAAIIRSTSRRPASARRPAARRQASGRPPWPPCDRGERPAKRRSPGERRQAAPLAVRDVRPPGGGGSG